MKTFLALIALAFTSICSAQEFGSMVSSALSVASSWVADHDMNDIISSGLAEASSWAADNDVNSIVSSGLAEASSWAANNDIDAMVSSIGVGIGITDSNGVSEALSRATAYFESLADQYGANITDLTTVTDAAVATSATQAEAASAVGGGASPTDSSADSEVDSDSPVSSLSSLGAAGGWNAPATAGIGGLFLGLVAYF